MRSIILVVVFIASLFAEQQNDITISNSDLNRLCVDCHRTEGIPPKMVYKHYLRRYSSQNRIVKAMKQYLRDPKLQNSLLPKHFTIKTGVKEPNKLSEIELEAAIQAYIERFNPHKHLRLEEDVDEK